MARRDWRDPFTHQLHRDVPAGLAQRLDELAAGAHPRPGEPHSADRSEANAQIRDQVQHLLAAFGQRDAYRRTLDKIHAGDDGLLPVSDHRRRELASCSGSPTPWGYDHKSAYGIANR